MASTAMAAAGNEAKGGKARPVPPPMAAAMDGATKAALWLLSVDERTAVAALALLNNEEIVRIRKSVESLEKFGPEQLAAIHNEFNRLLEEQPLRVRGSMEYLSHLAVQALGENKANLLLAPRDTLPPSQILMGADLDMLAQMMAEEHPQVIAALLATLTPQRASDVVMKLPEDLRKDVVSRVARLHKVPQAALARAQQVLSAALPVTDDQDYDVDGVRIAASMLNQLDSEKAEAILTALPGETTANDVRQAMFTFEDLAKLDKRGLQTLLKEVASDQLLMAMKAASDEIKNKVFEGLSKRAAEMMREDLQMLGPARLADVEKAQQDIVAVALRLRGEGKITVMGQGGDFV